MSTDQPPAGQPPQFYSALARWWPLISPVEEYAEEAEEFARVIKLFAPQAEHVLELGSGGGHNAAHLKRHFAMTLTDLSEEMLENSRALNPECRHVGGDMRTLRLSQRFDAVFAHDAIDYMASEAELAAAMATAYAHCKPGAIALFVCDATRESFSAGTECGGADGADGSGARYLEWTYDPDPSDDVVTTEYAFVFREADGRVSHTAETHLFGLFARATWERLLAAQGFEVTTVIEQTTDDRTPRLLFVGRRPVEEQAATV